MSPSESHAVRLELSRRKQKNPKPISSSGDMEDELDKSFEVNGDSNPGDQRDISELVKVEINNSADDIDISDTSNRNLRSPRTSLPLFPPMEDIMRKFNLAPFGDVTVPNHPNTPPVPMNIPMAFLFPVSKDEATGEAKYKMMISRTGPEVMMGFPQMFPLPSPPLIPHMNPRLPNNFIPEEITLTEQKKSKQEEKDSNEKNMNLKIECNDQEGSSTPLDLTHRSPNSSFSDIEEDAAKAQLPKKESFPSKQSPSASPEQKLGSEIEEQLHFLKVKQMEFLKQAAESVVNRCNECNINFSKYQNYLAHKKYYCSGLKPQQQQDSDEESSQATMASKKPSLPSPASPPFSPTSQPLPVPKQNIFNQDFFLSQKSLLENFPSKMPLLMGGPGAMGLQQPNTSHFVCQGCGIKFKSISNLKAHQSRYCSGIKNPEEGNNLEALLKNPLSQMPIPGMSAADMISFLSAQQAVKSDEQKKTVLPQTSRGKSPKGFSDSTTKSEPTDDFCCILCGFKESSVDKLKDHINMHFIGQVKKRKAENETDSHTSDDSNHSAPADAYEDHLAKKVKKEDDSGDKQEIHEGVRRQQNIIAGIDTENADVKQDAENNSLTCRNCDISFVNSTTYSAHVKYYCKKKPEDEQE